MCWPKFQLIHSDSRYLWSGFKNALFLGKSRTRHVHIPHDHNRSQLNTIHFSQTISLMSTLILHSYACMYAELTVTALISDSWPGNVCLHEPSLISHSCNRKMMAITICSCDPCGYAYSKYTPILPWQRRHRPLTQKCACQVTKTGTWHHPCAP
jgi:hypothetical protein